MLGGGVLAHHLLFHVVDLEGQNGQTVHGPGGRLGVDGGVGLHGNVAVERTEIRVDGLDQVGALLIAGIDAALEGQSLHGIDVGVADDVLQMPLHGVNPVLQVEVVLNGTLFEGVLYRRVHIVGDVIVLDGAQEDVVSECGKHDKKKNGRQPSVAANRS